MKKINKEKSTFGERASDGLASFGGSWLFLISFLIFILLWITLNVWMLQSKAFDQYPFILLNLFLSMLASVQAPIIMMSQKRQEARDRKRAELDFAVNKKAEREIRELQRKLDLLMGFHNIEDMEQN